MSLIFRAAYHEKGTTHFARKLSALGFGFKPTRTPECIVKPISPTFHYKIMASPSSQSRTQPAEATACSDISASMQQASSVFFSYRLPSAGEPQGASNLIQTCNDWFGKHQMTKRDRIGGRSRQIRNAIDGP